MGKRERVDLPRDGIRLLSEVAQLYYIEDLSQEQIARRVGGSRSNVSRMLKEARSRGLVEIRVHTALDTLPRLQEELRSRMGLRQCLALANVGLESRASKLADSRAAMAAFVARYLQENIADGSILGVGWSRTIYRSVNNGYLKNKSDVNVVQLMGSVGSSIPELNGISIAARLADALGANAHYLPAPMLVADAAVRSALLRDRNIRETLDVAQRADAMVVGVGEIGQDHGQYLTGYLDDRDLNYIRESGAVGDVCGSYFSKDGSRVPLEMDERTVAIGSEQMRHIPTRIGVSWGVQKALANIGAVRSGLLNVLIADENAIKAMLNILDGESLSSLPAESDTSN